MSHGTWTDEQWSAIQTHNCNLLVAAAAGSGKTAVLVERIIRRITEGENPIDIDRLLIVTFTNAAAAEMRERIAAALEKKIEIEPEKESLHKQLTLLNKAKIATIHSFCLDVIRENYHKLDLDPSFRIGDEAEINLLKSELLEEFFEEQYSAENNEDFLSLVETYGENTGDFRLRKLLLMIHSFSQSNPFPDQWLFDMSHRFCIAEDTLFEETFWGKLVKEEVLSELNGIKSLAEQSLEICRRFQIIEYESALLSDLLFLEELLLALSKGLQPCFSLLQSRKKLSILGRKKKNSDNVAIEKIKALRDLVKKGLTELNEKLLFKSPEELKQDLILLYPTLSSLGNLVIEFGKRFQALKKERNLADFNDMEHYCLQALLAEGSTVKNPIPSEAAVQLQQRFEEILTDEYQDSNLVQEMILSVISRQDQEKNNRFMVGDVKQSIYRFRLAKPEIFMEKYHTYSSTGRNQKIDLFKNFRSRPNILFGINFLFRQLMSPHLGELVYDKNAALYPGALFPEPEEGQICGGATELHLLDCSIPEEIKTKEEEEEIDDDWEELSSMELEVTFLAQKIQNLIQSKFCILDKETKKYRPVEYRDIVILLRAPRDWNPIFIEIFGNYDIPVYADTNYGFFETIEILTITNLLKIIDNPRQDIPILAILRSPLFRLSSNELVEIRFVGEKETFYDCILSYLELKKEDALSKKLKKFISSLERWRNKAVFLPIDELLWLLYQETGYLDYIGVVPGGKIRQANLRSLLDKAVQYENTSLKGLFHFVHYLEKIRKNKEDSGSAKILNENANLIKVLSIHKSKGLEFPVVFVSGLGKRFNKMDLNSPVLLHHDYGFGTSFIDYENRVTYSTAAKNVLAKKMTRELLSEEMRVLYVALTRAKEKLILTGGINKLEKSFPHWSLFTNEKNTALPCYPMLKANHFLDWIVPALSRHRDGELIGEKIGEVQLDQKNALFSDASQWKVEIHPFQEIIIEKKKRQKQEQESANSLQTWCADENYSNQKQTILRRLSWEYPYEAAVSLPANLSISEIKRHYQEELEPTAPMDSLEAAELDLKFPDFLRTEKPLTASEKGTALHTILQRLNLAKIQTKEEIQQEIQTCIKLKILTQQEANSISINRILHFFSSNLAQRLRRSHRIEKEKTFVISLSQKEIFPSDSSALSDETVLIHGIIDCYFYEEDGIVLLDYKTDFATEQTLEEIKQRYQVQISLYKKAIERITKIPVKETYLYLFSLGKEIKMEPSIF